MQRRDALKLLAGATALPLLPRNVFAIFQSVHAELSPAAALKTLNPQQDTIVTAICEIIIPETETPGAKAVRVNEFIDLVLTGWYDDKERADFLSGLADVDARSRELFGKGFADCAPHQQAEMVAALDDELAEWRAGQPAHLSRGWARQHSEDNFFHMMKRLTLIGYFTSQVGFEQALHKQIVPRTHSGCAAIPGETPAAN